VLEAEPRNFDALLLLAGAVSNAGETEAALRALGATAGDFGDRARFHMAVAMLALRQQDWARAERSFKEAVAREPKSVEAHMALGNFHATRGDAPLAEAALRTAADLAPMGSPARLRLAEFLAQTGRGEEGKRLLGEITQKAPDYLLAWRRIAAQAFAGHVLRGRLHLANGESTEAIQDFQKALQLEPGLALARHQLALAQLQAGNLQQARADLKEAAALDPGLAESILLLAELDIQAGALQPAIERLEGLVARAQGKAAEGRRFFEAALEMRPGYAEPLGQLADLAVRDVPALVVYQPDLVGGAHRPADRLEPHLVRIVKPHEGEQPFGMAEGLLDGGGRQERLGPGLDLGLEPLPAALDHPHRREVVGAQRRVVEPADQDRRDDPGDRVRPRSRRL